MKFTLLESNKVTFLECEWEIIFTTKLLVLFYLNHSNACNCSWPNVHFHKVHLSNLMNSYQLINEFCQLVIGYFTTLKINHRERKGDSCCSGGHLYLIQKLCPQACFISFVLNNQSSMVKLMQNRVWPNRSSGIVCRFTVVDEFFQLFVLLVVT